MSQEIYSLLETVELCKRDQQNLVVSLKWFGLPVLGLFLVHIFWQQCRREQGRAIFECRLYLPRVSAVKECEISAREDRIRIPKRPCNVLFIIQILMKCSDLRNGKSGYQPLKHACCLTSTRYMKNKSW